MNPKNRHWLLEIFILSALGFCLGCVAKSGHALRFRESAVMTKPQLSPDISGGAFSFIFVGDIHLGGSDTGRLRTILQAAKDQDDAFIVFLGDMTDKGLKADFETFQAVVSEYSFQNKVIYAIGNHDVFDDGWRAYRDLMGPTHFSVVVGNCRFIILDSADGVVGEDQTQWLEETLKEKGDFQHTFLVTHYMPVVPGQRTYLRLSNETEATHLMKTMSRFGVKAWLGGHYHSFAKEQIEGVDYIVAGGGGGRRMEPVKDLFYVRARVDKENITYQLNRF